MNPRNPQHPREPEHDVHTLRRIAEEAVDAGARWLAAEGAGGEWARVRRKPSGEEVTDADVEVERRVTEALVDRMPDIPVIGEESSGAGPLPARCWLLDPIDGTMNFTRGAPGHALSLAHVVEGSPVLGVVHAPALGRRWSAGEPGGQGTLGPVAVRALSGAVVGLTGTGSGRPRAARLIGGLYDKAYRIRLQGAMSLDLVGVAEGWLDACVCLGPKPWDVAAGTALVRERGGAVLGEGGREFTFGSTVLAAGNPLLAQELIALWESTAD
ncbi:MULTISPECIES: inositol monophosphatase [unclassified Streptomyces]|uniref:inositol monophosphatase family protein n=1 Tax=unclassified Streptomyces TaxID=2593676 RepID=UPI00093C82F3|nr:inositol monophosphatase [Streptomyces sp. TSRI0281]OKI34777.1 monophosphatase [Streptomyces sp. TSRI0281]